MKNYYVAMRQEAIKRYNQGEKPVSIYKSLGRSKKWFFKWLKRCQEGAAKWYLDEKRSRKRQEYAVSKTLEDIIVKTRKELESKPYSQIGACKIRHELKKQEIEEVPETWKINRVLKRHKLTHPQGPYVPKEKKYPRFIAERPGMIRQADFTPARKIEHEGIVRALNDIDIYSHKAKVHIMRNRCAETTIKAFIKSLEELGIPKYQQIDNDPVFRSAPRDSNRWSRVLRMLTFFEIEVIFTPPGEPWRNGYVEHFNGIYKHKFFNSRRWVDINEIQKEAKIFEAIYNNNYCCSARNGATPNETTEQYELKYLDNKFKIPTTWPYPKTGKIHFMRFIRSDRRLGIFEDVFTVHKDLTYEYVKATFDIKEQALFVYYEDKLVQTFKYKLF